MGRKNLPCNWQFLPCSVTNIGYAWWTSMDGRVSQRLVTHRLAPVRGQSLLRAPSRWCAASGSGKARTVPRPPSVRRNAKRPASRAGRSGNTGSDRGAYGLPMLVYAKPSARTSSPRYTLRRSTSTFRVMEAPMRARSRARNSFHSVMITSTSAPTATS